MAVGTRAGRAVEDDSWERWAAEQDRLGEVEAELREWAADGATDAELLRAGGRLLADRCPGAPELRLEWRLATGRLAKVLVVKAATSSGREREAAG